MPQTFSVVPAAPLPAGQRVLEGDVEQFAFSRQTRLVGTNSSTLSNAPALTLVGNLRTIPASVRNWDVQTLAGLGLSLETSTAAGAFPEVAARDLQTFPTAVTSHIYAYPLVRQVTQLLVVVVATAALTTVSTPAGWTLEGTQAGTESRTSVFFRIIDGTEADTETFTFGTASACLIRSWLINLIDGDVEVVSAINDSAAGTSLDIGTISPTWSLTEAANTLYIAVLGLAIDATVSGFPAGYTITGQDALVSGTANLDATLAYAERNVLSTTENPGPFTYPASRATGHVIAIKPDVAGRINWDGLLFRKAGVDVATRRAINIIDGTNITTTVVDNGVDAVNVTINATGGAGTPTWAQVLAVGRVTGGVGNNPHIDTGDILSFGVIGSLPPTGSIRSSTDIEIRAVGGVELISTTTMQLQTIGSVNMRFVTNGVQRLRLDGDGTWQVNGTGGTAGQYLRSAGAGATPTWATPTPAEVGVTAVTGAISHAATGGASLFSGILDNGGAENDRAALNFLSGTHTTTVITDDAGNNELEIVTSVNLSTLVPAIDSASVVANGTVLERAALTGAIASSQNANTTTFAGIRDNGTLETARTFLNFVAGTNTTVTLTQDAGNDEIEVAVSVTGLVSSGAVTGAISHAAGGGASLFSGILDNGAAENDRQSLNFLSGTHTTTAITDDAGNNELEIVTSVNLSTLVPAIDSTSIIANGTVLERAALTGAISSTQNSNATLFAGIRDNGTLETARTFLNFVAGANTTVTLTQDAGNDEIEVAVSVTGITSSGAVTGAIAHAAGGGASTFAGIRDNGAAENDRTNLNFIAGTNTTATVTDDAGNDELEIRFNVDNFPLSGLADQASDTVVTNITAGSAPPTAVLWTNLMGQGLQWNGVNHVIDLNVAPGSHITTEPTSRVARFQKDRIRDTWWEEFTFAQTLSGGTSVTVSGTIAHGQTTNWWIVATGATGVWDVATVGVSQGHPGIWSLETGNVSGNSMAMYNGVAQSLGFEIYRGSDIFMAEAIMRINLATTKLWEFGFRDQAGNNFIEFYADTSAGTGSTTLIHSYTEEGGVITDNNTSVTDTSNAWVALTILQDTPTIIDFYIDDVLQTSHSTNVPDSEAMGMFFRVTTRTAAVRALEIDYCMFQSYNLGASNRTT